MSEPGGALPVETLRGPALVLEPLRVEHAGELAPLLDDSDLHVFTGGAPETLEQLTARYARQVRGRSADGSQQWLNWIVRRADTGEAVGTVQATVFPASSSAELAWVIARSHQHRGFARQAADIMATWLRGHGIASLLANIHPEHQASAGVARAIGLSPTDVLVDGEVRWQN